LELRCRDGGGDQRFLVLPRPPLQLMLALERVAERLEGFRVDQADRTTPGCVARAAAAVVRLLTRVRIARVSRVQRAVGAADDVDEMQS